MQVICFGDSNTYGYDPRSLFGEPYPAGSCWVDILREKTGWDLINQGQNGREVPVQPEEFPAGTDLLMVMLGTNDLLQLDCPEATAERMEAFLTGLSLSREKLLLIAPPAMVPGAWVQDADLIRDSAALAVCYRALSEKLGIHFADGSDWAVEMAFDGVHFTQKGHRQFAEELYDFLRNQEICHE